MIPLFQKNRNTFLLLFFVVVSFTTCNRKATENVSIGKVQKGTLFLDLYETGEIKTVNSVFITAPHLSWRYGGVMKINQLVEDGTEVKKGDTIVSFNPGEVQKAIISAEQRLKISEMTLVKMRAQQQSVLEEAEANYKIAELSYKISKIRFESVDYEADIKKREIKLNLEKSKMALDKAREHIENQKKIQKEEIKQKQIQIKLSKTELEEAKQALHKLYVVSPSSGITVLQKNWSTGNKMKVGDQCWRGSDIAELPDMSHLKAVININEVDVAKMEKGQKVEIKPDAFSEKTFTGKVSSIANLAVSKDRGSKIKVFPVEIILDQTDKNLLPGLTVSCRIIFDKLSDVLYIPLEAIVEEAGESYVFKKKRGGFDKVKVELGRNNNDFIVVKKGLEENDEIALSNPFEKEKEEQNNEKKEKRDE